MSVDTRTRLAKDVRDLGRDEIIDAVVPDAIAAHGDLAGRGVTYHNLPPLGIVVDGRSVTLEPTAGTVDLRTGVASAGVIAALDASVLSDLVQDVQSPMGLAMTSRVKISTGSLNDWIGWEPVLRALLDGRKVHEVGDVTFVEPDGLELDLGQTFTVGDDREEMANFLEQAGFLHLRGVFDAAEGSPGGRHRPWIAEARPDDGESWWATHEQGREQAVRVLFFDEKSSLLRSPRGSAHEVAGCAHRRRAHPRRWGRRPGEATWDRPGAVRPALAQGLWPGEALLHLQQSHLRHLGDRRRSVQRCAWRHSREPPGQHHGGGKRPPPRSGPTGARNADRRRDGALLRHSASGPSTGGTAPEGRLHQLPPTAATR